MKRWKVDKYLDYRETMGNGEKMYRTITTKEQLDKALIESKSVTIYGAGIVAYGVYLALNEIYKIEKIDFVVSDTSAHRMIKFCDVKDVSEIDVNDEQGLFIVATPEVYHAEIKEKLDCRNIRNIIYVTNQVEFLFMSQYYKKKTDFVILKNEIPKGYIPSKDLDENDALVCMCQSVYDVELETKIMRESFVKTMHVGKQIDNMIESELVDCTGDNISEKNRMYSELTATYWLWKNSDKMYKGIYHYRRQLNVSNREIQWCIENDVDVILPLPYVCYPDTKGQYGRYIDEEDEQILFRAIQECVPDEIDVIQEILENKYIYNYNMLIAKREVFDSYCEWMFPILFKAEDIRKSIRPNGKARFAGYFGEVLTSVFFLKNRNKYNIVHVQREWYK